jgi:hypothetical protein
MARRPSRPGEGALTAGRGARADRQRRPDASAHARKSSVFRRRPQPAFASMRQLSPSLRHAASTAARAPERRSQSWPSCQNEAEIGSGWPPHWLSRQSPRLHPCAKTSVCSATGCGSTFSVTSAITQRTQAAGEQARDIVAGDVLHHLTAEIEHLPATVDQLHAEHEIAHRPRLLPARPGQPGGDAAADRRAAEPKCAGKTWARKASICPFSASAASISPAACRIWR